jgi:alkanesulfonate monooxygenase SsuD/methylene tetrahydromethanopterin reductase-like flavin-dependent oxidoreductase (luciferase family)
VLLCHHVLGQGYRQPALTAKMAATLQVLSGGRFILGIGAGWREDEYKAYGYDFPKASVRFAQLEEVIHICRAMWTEDLPNFSGKHFSIHEASAPPLPHPIPPICIGASGEQIGLPMVGRLADMWNGGMRKEADWIRKRDIVLETAERVGRHPHDIEISLTVERALPSTDAESDEFRDRLEHLVTLGVNHFVMDFGHPNSTEPVMRFVEQVIAPMRAEKGPK